MSDLQCSFCTALHALVCTILHCCTTDALLLLSCHPELLCTAALLDCAAMLHCAALLNCCTAVAVPLCCARHHDTKITMWLGCTCQASFNSLTPKCILAGTKNSLSEDFLLAKHEDTNIPTMMEPERAYPTPRSLRRRGWKRPSSKDLI